jgi:hypothetical protein
VAAGTSPSIPRHSQSSCWRCAALSSVSSEIRCSALDALDEALRSSVSS